MDLLTDKLEDAEYLADLALNRALEINGTAMEIKSRNLLGIIQYFSNKAEAAFSTWRKDLVISAQRVNKDGIVKLHTNLGAATFCKVNMCQLRKNLNRHMLFIKNSRSP